VKKAIIPNKAHFLLEEYFSKIKSTLLSCEDIYVLMHALNNARLWYPV